MSKTLPSVENILEDRKCKRLISAHNDAFISPHQKEEKNWLAVSPVTRYECMFVSMWGNLKPLPLLLTDCGLYILWMSWLWMYVYFYTYLYETSMYSISWCKLFAFKINETKINTFLFLLLRCVQMLQSFTHGHSKVLLPFFPFSILLKL